MEFVDTNTTLRNVAQKIRGAPMITLRRAMIQALRDWCAETNWLRTTVTMDTTAQSGLDGVYLVTLDAPLDELIEVISIRNHMIALDPQTNKHFRVWPEANPERWNPDANTSKPRHYAYVPEGMFN